MVEDISEVNAEGTTLRKAQLRLLHMLIEIDSICRKHNIEYWLIAGTLLGAFRHKGFIPWDDDIDISILQKDVKKLKAILKKELSSQYLVQDYTADRKYFMDSVIKIRDKNSYFPVEVFKNLKEQGLVVDIIPMENLPSMKFKRFVFNFNKHPYLRRKEISLHGKSNNIKGLILTPFSNLLIQFAHWYSEKSTTNKFGYNYLFWLGKTFEMQFDKNIFFPLKTMEFEGREFFVPNQSEKYLELVYGDFMKIPPINERQIHSSNIEVYD